MNRPAIVALLAVLVALPGCGGKPGSDTGQSQAPPSSTPPPDTAAQPPPAAVSAYDQGPRAGETPVKVALATQGEALFKTKGCVACHGFGKKITCPDLAGVSMRRTALWMENQILHPERMTREDPIAHELFTQYKLQMPNQGLTLDQARSVIEFLKRQDRVASGSK